MEDKRFEKLEKDVNYLNEEGFAGEEQQFILFRNADEAIEAIRKNQVPGISWNEDDEARWQAAMAIDRALDSEEIETVCDEFNDGSLDAGEWFLDTDCDIDRLIDQGTLELQENWTIDENGT